MPTLAQMVRAKHPGSYDDLDDAALDRMVRTKFPGVYDDIPGEQPKSPETGITSSIPYKALAGIGRAGMGVAEFLNPIAIGKGIYGMVTDHKANILDPMAETERKAAEAESLGRGPEAAAYRVAAKVPVLGPMAASVGEEFATGDPATALGHTVALVGGGELARRAPALARGAFKSASEASPALKEGAAVLKDAASVRTRILNPTVGESALAGLGGLVAGKPGATAMYAMAKLPEMWKAIKKGRSERKGISGAQAEAEMLRMSPEELANLVKVEEAAAATEKAATKESISSAKAQVKIEELGDKGQAALQKQAEREVSADASAVTKARTAGAKEQAAREAERNAVTFKSAENQAKLEDLNTKATEKATLQASKQKVKDLNQQIAAIAQDRKNRGVSPEQFEVTQAHIKALSKELRDAEKAVKKATTGAALKGIADDGMVTVSTKSGETFQIPASKIPKDEGVQVPRAARTEAPDSIRPVRTDPNAPKPSHIEAPIAWLKDQLERKDISVDTRDMLKNGLAGKESNQATSINDYYRKESARQAKNIAEGAKTEENLGLSIELMKKYPKYKGETMRQWKDRVFRAEKTGKQ